MSIQIRHLSRLCLQSQTSCRPNILPIPSQCRLPSSIRSVSILSSIADNPGAYHKKIRRGRGPGSGKGKTSGRGHGGQKSRGKVPVGFQGGQTPEWKVHGVKGFENPFTENMTEINLDRLQYWVDSGKINPNRPVTFLELHNAGCIRSVGDGVKILARGKEHLKTPLHLIVSRASTSAIAAIESVGGSVTTRYYTPFSIQKILRGQTDPIHSRLFIPTPITKLSLSNTTTSPSSAGGETVFQYALPDPVKRKDLEYYRDQANRGYLSYMVPPGQTPSLFFKTPGLGRKTAVKKRKVEDESANKIW